jgi:hypothetical protein
MHTVFAIAGGLIPLLGCVSYVHATLRGGTRPNRVTWLLWAAVPLIAVAAQLRSGVGASAIVTASASLGPAAVLSASFLNRGAYWRLGPFDYVCGALALAALVAWMATSQPDLAIALSILADFAAALPTFRKAWAAPETEDRRTFALSAAGMVFGLASVQQASFAGYAFNLYLLAANCGLVLLLSLPRRSPALSGRTAP